MLRLRRWSRNRGISAIAKKIPKYISIGINNRSKDILPY